MIRSVLFAVVFYGLTAVFAILYLPCMLMPRKILSRLSRLWVRLMLVVIRSILGIRYELRGTENIPDGPAIFASKHQSAWDVLIYNVIVPDCAYVLKRELYRIPFWGWYLWRIGMVGVDRSAGAKALKKLVTDATALLDSGRSIVIFPQGTRTAPGESRPYLPGAAAMYTGAGYPVVPVALNSGSLWPRRTFVKKPGVITVEFLPPIPPGLDRRTFLSQLSTQIESATQRLEQSSQDESSMDSPVAR